MKNWSSVSGTWRFSKSNANSSFLTCSKNRELSHSWICIISLAYVQQGTLCYFNIIASMISTLNASKFFATNYSCIQLNVALFSLNIILETLLFLDCFSDFDQTWIQSEKDGTKNGKCRFRFVFVDSNEIIYDGIFPLTLTCDDTKMQTALF